ncbi:MAG: TasA family protein [Acidimicrobiales bacterium]
MLILRSLGTIAIVSVVVGVMSVVAGALFSSTDFVSNNTFTMSTIILDATPNSAAFAVPSMGPGEESVVEFNIANTGNAELRYAMTSETTEDVLASELIFTVREGVTTCDQASWDATGVQIYQGKLGDTVTIGGWPTFGDAATGGDAGDRALAPSTSEALCFHVMLPASSTVQNTSTNATFHFLAEQTANN